MLLYSAITALYGCTTEPPPEPATPAVNVITVTEAPLPLELAHTARARGVREVEVHARVSGILKRRFYTQGEGVEAGALLFEIDPAPFQAAVRSAAGRVGVERARLAEAKLQQARIQKLSNLGVSADRERDLAEAAFAAAQAALESAEAELARAELDLSYTSVRAPIAGLTGAEVRSEGSLIDASGESSLLTRITQTDRLYIDFAIPETEAQLVREAIKRDASSIRVQAQPLGREPLATRAQIEFLDARVHPATGTVEVRAILDNSAQVLAPGQFVQARIEGLTTGVGFYIPLRAVIHGADGPFVWVIDEADKAQIRAVTLGTSHGNLIHVRSGVSEADRIVVDGVLKLRSNEAAEATTVALDARPSGVAAGS